MAKKVALINMKGGVGKSTLAVQLAWHMATRPWNKRVLVVDLDPQFNCTQYLLGGGRTEAYLSSSSPTVWNIFEQLTAVPGRPSSPFVPSDAVTNVQNYRSTTGLIDLIPSQIEVSQVLRNPAQKDQLLRQAVEGLETQYDLVVVDCPPTDSILTTAAYLASDYILIPVRPEFLSTVGLPLLQRSLLTFETPYPGESPDVLGIVFNRPAYGPPSPEERRAKRDVANVARGFGWRIFDEEIEYSRSVPKSSRGGLPIFSTSYVQTKTSTNFRRFANEFAQRVGI